MEKRKLLEEAQSAKEPQMEEKAPESEIVAQEPDDLDIENLEDVLPKMNVSVPSSQEPVEEESLITDEALLGIYHEILKGIREDREEVTDYISNLAEMVFNEGDSTTASKEALVNLVKVKVDLSDKTAKVADLMTRIKLKAKDTFPRYLAAHQNNTINIGDSGRKRQLLEAISKAKKKKGDK